ncbi:MAG: hypothetical protein NTX66_01575, partial [Candidatus Falkowbacteria bacterium]|nr:hypothetical protein [Candidatus Falkowbacteria bacterium]
MKESAFKPEKYKEYRDKTAEEIKAIPKDEERKSRRESEHKTQRRFILEEVVKKSSMYNYSKMLHREERDFVNNLLESGEVKSKDEAEQKWAEHVFEQENSIKEWVDNDYCDPDLAPEFLIDNRSRAEMIWNDVQENASKKVEELIQENPKIIKLVESFKLSPKEGVYEWDYYGPRKIENNSFLEASGKSDVSKEQREEVQKIVGDEKKLGLFLNELRDKKNQEIFSNNMMGFNDPTGGEYFVIAQRNLESIFGKRNIPYLTYQGDRSYSIKPFGKDPRGQNKIRGQYINTI